MKLNSKEPVRLREKKLKNGVKSLYLDIIQDGQRSYEFLKLYILPGNDPATREKNQSAIESAQVIKAERLVELQQGKANIMSAKKRNIRFVDYYREYYTERPYISAGYRRSAEFALVRWINYIGEDIHLSKVTPEILMGFGKYLGKVHNIYNRRKVKIYPGEGREGGSIPTKEAEDIVRELSFRQKKSFAEISRLTGIHECTVRFIRLKLLRGGKEQPLSSGTIKRYFKCVSTVLNRASGRGLIAVNPVAALDARERPQERTPERVYLTLDEVSRLAKAPCDYPVVKRMFLFSCFTGLRLSDVKSLTWDNVVGEKICVVQQKTKTAVYIPLSKNAKRWMTDDEELPEKTMFPGCPDKNTMARCINKWVRRAGIGKHVTFHIARHTFATLSLEYGADLYTVSKLLGHQKITTTQIYAKVVDKKKEEAVNLIPDLNQ